MITLEELFTLVEKEFDRDFDENEFFRENWERMKATLEPHIEQYPGPVYIDEYGNENWDDYEEVVSYGDTYDDELAYFCWRCGCNLYTSYDWIDGSPEYTITLPDTEEQYQKNLAEADKWWKEVMEE